jgi:hypothetical protein
MWVAAEAAGADGRGGRAPRRRPWRDEESVWGRSEDALPNHSVCKAGIFGIRRTSRRARGDQRQASRPPPHRLPAATS